MRRRKSKMAVLSICLTGLLVCLTACETSIGRPGREEKRAETETASGSLCSPEGMTSDLPETDSVMDSLTGSEALAQAELPQPYAGYLEVLEYIRWEGRDPNGVEYFTGQTEEFENNCFAICDVDRDGRQELLFHFSESSLAGMRETVYEYDMETDNLHKELTVWVNAEYYSNGIVKDPLSHNHGKDPTERGIWPYLVYEYDADEDAYHERYRVDAWDGELYQENFPAELDADGDKLVYCVGTVEAVGDVSVEDIEIMDGEEYRLWAETLMPSWCRIEPAYRPVTEEDKEGIRSAYAQAYAYGAQVECWLPGDEVFGPSLRDCLLYDMDRDGRLELITSLMEGTGRYSDNHFYRLTAAGEVEELLLVRLNNGREKESVDDFDIGGVARVQAYEDGGIVYYEGNDYVREGIYGVWVETGFYYLKDGIIYQDSIRIHEELFADGEQRKENVIHYYDMSWKEITKEQYEALREDYISDKQETAAYQNWTCFSRDETEGGALAPELTEEEIILRLFHSFLGSR